MKIKCIIHVNREQMRQIYERTQNDKIADRIYSMHTGDEEYIVADVTEIDDMLNLLQVVKEIIHA